MTIRLLTFIIFWNIFYSIKNNAQSNSCNFLIPEIERCPGSTNLEIRGSDHLVSETDGSELIYNSNGRLISIAGWDGVGLSHNRIRYSDDDGFTWQAAANGPFAPRHTFSIIEDDGFFYLIGGDYENTVNERKEIWKSASNDGLNWTLHTADTPFGNQVLFQVIKYNNNWYAIGGQFTSNGNIQPLPLRNIYISNDKGINWTLLNQGVMPEIGLTWACTTVFKDKVWIVAGGTYNAGALVSNKVYSTSDFLTWSEEADYIYPSGTMWNRVFTSGDYIFTHGGYQVNNSDTKYTFVSKDGKIWVDLTNPQSTKCHAAAVVPIADGFICNQPFSGNYGSIGVFNYKIDSYQKCFTNTTFTDNANDNKWSNPNNWSRGIPGENHFVEIQKNKTCNFDIPTISIGKIEVEENATLNLNGNFKIIKSDTFGVKNFGDINLIQGNIEIDSILGNGIINYGKINVIENSSLTIKNAGCIGIDNMTEGTINVVNQQSLSLTLNKINNIGIKNSGVFDFKGLGSFSQINGDAIDNSGILYNNGNLSLNCDLLNDTYHLNNSGIFFNHFIFTGHSKLGLKNSEQGNIDNHGTVFNFGGLNIDGIFYNRINAQFFNY